MDNEKIEHNVVIDVSRSETLSKGNPSSSQSSTNELLDSLKIRDFFPKSINASSETQTIKEETSKKEYGVLGNNFHEGTFIKGWKIVESVSSRIIEFDEEIVVLECLVDKERGIYEEREFDKLDFSCTNLEIGKLLKLCFYRRNNQVMMEIMDTPGIVAAEDFPNMDFAQIFKNVPLDKKK